MGKRLHLLHVEDSQDDADLLLHALKCGGYDVVSKRVDTAEAMRASLESEDWQLVISDFSMPNFSGLAALSLLKEMKLDIPFILVSGTVGEEIAVSAMKAGASDYIMKDKLMRLLPAVERELSEAANRVVMREKDEQLRQAQKMEVVGQLAGGIAHDFNNVLGAILMYCDLLQVKIPASDPMHAEVGQIRKSGERAAALTRQLLAFSRKQVLEARVLDLNALISNMKEMLGTLIGEHIHLSTRLEPNLGRVKADPGQLEQVIMNLVVNARDAMPKGGRLVVTTENVSLPADGRTGTYVAVSVSDTGCGMDARTQSKMFEPFFTTKGPGKGTGLGLSTVFGIVSQCRGAISVESEVGKGATFKVMLPQLDLPAEPNSLPEALRLERPRLGGTILLVEDESALRDAICKCLERDGFEVLKPATAGDAIAIIENSSEKIDLLITDVVMPHLGGPELASRLRQVRPKAKVLFISGFLDDTLDGFDIQSSRASFLQKPFSSEALLRKVSGVLNGDEERG